MMQSQDVVELVWLLSVMTAILVIFGLFLVWMMVNYLLTRRKLSDMKKQVESQEFYIRYQQIRPYFIYNLLNTIYVTIDEDSEKAGRMIYKLVKYLQSNTRIREAGDLTPFATEINYLNQYADITRERFPDFKIIYDLQDEDFMIPPFVVQALVENTLLNGFADRENEAEFRISSYIAADSRAVVTISDNSRGETPDKVNQDSESLQKRMRLLVNGNMVVTMLPEEGKVITITFERKKCNA